MGFSLGWTFNRTAYGIENFLMQLATLLQVSFNRTAYGIENCNGYISSQLFRVLLIAPLMELKNY